MSRTTERDAVRQFQETNFYTRRPDQGRTRCTTARDDRFMVSNVLRNRFISASEISSQLKEVRNVSVSLRTVRRRLVERNLKAFSHVRAPQRLPQHRRERLRFAREHADWTMHQWSNVFFSDETRISLSVSTSERKVFTMCHSGNGGFQGGSIMLWGGISYEARTDLEILERGESIRFNQLMIFWFHPRKEHYSIDALSNRHIRERNEATLFCFEGEVVGLEQA